MKKPSITPRRLRTAALLAALAPLTASACGPEPYIGAVCTFGYNFCPRGWTEANGQLIAIAQNTALFSLLGTQFGGNGQTTFAVPDLRGRSIVGHGQGPGLANIEIGEQIGAESTTLTATQLPAHTHAATTTISVDTKLRASTANGTADTPAGNVVARLPRSNNFTPGPATSDMDASAIATTASATTQVGVAGGSAPVGIRSPGLGMITCIATEGIFPSRN